jgi:hypothetical protein
MIFLIHGKNFCKCHDAPPPSPTVKKRITLIIRKKQKATVKGRQDWKKQQRRWRMNGSPVPGLRSGR